MVQMLWHKMNLPNKLTVARFILTMVFLALSAVPADNDGHHFVWWRLGFVLCVIAGLTDFFDGYLARKYDLVTDFGKLMDPLTDKIFTVTGFVVLTAHDVVPGWITVLILTREFAVTGLRTMAANRGEVMSAAFSGKLKTVMQMLTLLVGGFIWVDWLPYLHIPAFLITWRIILGLIAALTIYSGIEYFYRGRNLYLHDMR